MQWLCSIYVFGIGSFVLPGRCPHMEAMVATAVDNGNTEGGFSAIVQVTLSLGVRLYLC